MIPVPKRWYLTGATASGKSAVSLALAGKIDAATLMAAGAQMVKIEGGAEMAETTHFLTSRGIPSIENVLQGPFGYFGMIEAKGDPERIQE